jgi:hypothetical protein
MMIDLGDQVGERQRQGVAVVRRGKTALLHVLFLLDDDAVMALTQSVAVLDRDRHLRQLLVVVEHGTGVELVAHAAPHLGALVGIVDPAVRGLHVAVGFAAEIDAAHRQPQIVAAIDNPRAWPAGVDEDRLGMMLPCRCSRSLPQAQAANFSSLTTTAAGDFYPPRDTAAAIRAECSGASTANS